MKVYSRYVLDLDSYDRNTLVTRLYVSPEVYEDLVLDDTSPMDYPIKGILGMRFDHNTIRYSLTNDKHMFLTKYAVNFPPKYYEIFHSIIAKSTNEELLDLMPILGYILESRPISDKTYISCFVQQNHAANIIIIED